MTNDFEKVTKVIGKNTYEFIYGLCSCSIYRLSDKAMLGKVCEAQFYFHGDEEKAQKTKEYEERIQNYLIRKEARRQENLQYRREHKRKTPAQYIKEALNEAFPGVKFSCRYTTFSGGDDVHVSRKGGPLTSEVEAIADQFQAGHFDGMIDMYEYTNDKPYEMTAKYVFCEREADDEETKERVDELGDEFVNTMVKNATERYQYAFDRKDDIASSVTCHLEYLDSNNGVEYSHSRYDQHKEKGYIIARYLMNTYQLR